jgi:hypothetical protein
MQSFLPSKLVVNSSLSQKMTLLEHAHPIVRVGRRSRLIGYGGRAQGGRYRYPYRHLLDRNLPIKIVSFVVVARHGGGARTI